MARITALISGQSRRYEKIVETTPDFPADAIGEAASEVLQEAMAAGDPLEETVVMLAFQVDDDERA